MLSREERAAKLFAIEREAARVARRMYVVIILICFGWMGIGLFLLGWAFHTTDEGVGRIAFLSGILVTDAGVLGTLVYAYNRAEREGWL